MPDNVLSSAPLPAQFVGARRLLVREWDDYEDGGIALNDPSAGLQYQAWHAYIAGDDVILEAEHVAPSVLYSGAGINEISLAFDQNMRPVLAFVQAGAAYLRWYDTSVSAQVITPLGEGVQNPRVTMDDKRYTQVHSSDVILAYIRDGGLYTRMQRDRYIIEYLQASGLSHSLIKIGMNAGNRLQFLLQEL